MTVRAMRLEGLKPLVVGAMACLAMGSAQAYDDVLGPLAPLDSAFEVGVGFPQPTFLDTLSFSLSAPVAGSFTVKGQGLIIPGFLTLMPATDLTFALYKGGVALTGFGASFSGLNLSAGDDYSFLVAGKSGGYHVTWSLSPVPEPESIALALAGVAVVGATARRRWTQG